MSATPPPRRGPGRPRAAERGVCVSTWLPASDCDRLIRLARAHDVSLSRVLRVELRHGLQALARGDVRLPGDE